MRRVSGDIRLPSTWPHECSSLAGVRHFYSPELRNHVILNKMKKGRKWIRWYVLDWPRDQGKWVSAIAWLTQGKPFVILAGMGQYWAASVTASISCADDGRREEKVNLSFRIASHRRLANSPVPLDGDRYSHEDGGREGDTGHRVEESDVDRISHNQVLNISPSEA